MFFKTVNPFLSNKVQSFEKIKLTEKDNTQIKGKFNESNH